MAPNEQRRPGGHRGGARGTGVGETQGQGTPLRLVIPLSGAERRQWLDALDDAIRADAERTLLQMWSEGWDLPDAAESYHDWSHARLDLAIAEALRRLAERRAA